MRVPDAAAALLEEIPANDPEEESGDQEAPLPASRGGAGGGVEQFAA